MSAEPENPTVNRPSPDPSGRPAEPLPVEAPSAEPWRALFDAVDDAVVFHDARTGRVVDVNQAACELFRCSREEFLRLGVADLSGDQPPYTQEDARQWARRAVTEGPQRFEWQVCDRLGRHFWVEVGLRYVQWPDGPRVAASMRDVSARKRAEETLRETQERFRRITSATRDMVHLADEDGRLLFVNPATPALLGHPEEELLGRPVASLVHPEDRERVLEALNALRAGSEVPPFEARLLTRDGEALEVETSGFRVSGSDGACYLGAILRNLTGRRSAERERAILERELSRGQALEAMGRLAGGVAHEFNNLLGSILGCVYVARLAAGEGADTSGELDRIQALCKRGGDLTRQLLTVARRQPGAVEHLNVGLVLEEVRSLLGPTLPKTVRLEVSAEPGLPRVRAERTLLGTALLNLALNARDAMPNGGTLTLRARLHRDGRGAEWVDLAVADTGVGIPDEVREHIFQPFYTTKTVGKGTGLGLATARASVQAWGGELLLESARGRGSTFTVRLPAAPSASAASADPAASPGRAAHPLTQAPLLVVEDEEDVARLMVRALEEQGYDVIRAATGIEALERLRVRRGGFGLVVLDPILPEWGGEGLYRMLRGLVPEVPVLLVSGREDVVRELAPEGPRLVKPFTAAEFLEAVTGALQALP